jgi:hypothetical protein
MILLIIEASLASAEVSAGAVAKADQNLINNAGINQPTTNHKSSLSLPTHEYKDLSLLVIFLKFCAAELMFGLV